VAKRVFQLELLYSDFISESARLLVDALQHSLENPSTLAPIYAVIGRVRLSASTDVIDSAERLMDTIIKTHSEPNLTLDEVRRAASKHNDRIYEFSTICRRELESLRERF
jgi:hypothetical protein